MGGNALKNTTTRRYSADEYHKIASKMKQELHELLGVRVEIIPSYTTKDSFGDLDLLVESNHLSANWKERITMFYKLRECDYISNGDVFSFAHNQLQVDMITTPKSAMDSSMQYFAYNDLGNLMGRIMHKLGIKYGHKGLSLTIRSPDNGFHILSEIWLETEKPYEVACEIMGLDSNTKFHTLDDIFVFVTKSKYFDPDIYSLHNRNHDSRVRDNKRKTYNGFLNYIRENNVPGNYNFNVKHDKFGYNIREPFYTDIILPRWPWVGDAVKGIIDQYELDRAFKVVYNGGLVSELTGFTGKRLGAFMTQMKLMFNNELKQEWINTPNLAVESIKQLWIDVGGERYLTEME